MFEVILTMIKNAFSWEFIVANEELGNTCGHVANTLLLSTKKS